MDLARQRLRGISLSLIVVSIFFVISSGITKSTYAGQAILTWDPPTTNADGTPLTDLAGYKVYYGTASGNYSTVIDAANVTSYTVPNLTNNLIYYFATTAYDTTANESNFSNEVSKTIAGTTDTTPPLLSNITTSSITTTSAVIAWTSDEVSTSQVDYGTTISYGSSTTIDNTLVTSHSVAISGLSSWTTYHFRVKSQDAAGNLATSSDLTFTTIAPPDTTAPTGTISINSGTSYITSTSATLTLFCSDSGSGCSQMRFSNDGTTWNAWESYATSKAWTLATTDGVKTVYVQYRDANSNTSQSYTDTITLDTTAPTGTISINSGASYTTSTAVTLTLSCSDSGSGCSQMRLSNTGTTWNAWESYATSKAWTLAATDGVKTVYVQYRDTNSNTSQSYTDTITLDTTTPVISGIGTSNLTSNSVTISWTTGEASDTQADYGTTTSYGSSTTLNTTLVTSHSVALSSLSSSTVYHYRVRSRDAAGNLATSTDYTFTTATPPDTTAPVISNISAGSITSAAATVTWTTNEASTTRVEYGTTTSYGSFSTLDSALVTSHTVTLSGLTPITTYYFRVLSSDQAGNQGTSAGSNFTTLQVPQPDPPAAIQDLTVRAGASSRNSVILDWTATGADGTEGTASAYDLRMSTQKIIEDGLTPAQGEVNFSTAVKINGMAAPKIAGSSESVQIGQLETNGVYYFAIKAIDNKGLISAISSVVNGTTIPPVPVTAVRQGYTMISIPLVPATTEVQTLLGGFMGTPVELYWWSSNGSGDSSGTFIAETNIVPGYGYFLKSNTGNAVLNITGTAVTDPSRVIPLQPGWNMIGNPYPQEVALRNTYIRKINTSELKSYEDAVIAGWVSNSLYSFNGSTYDFTLYTDATLKLWQGYWISILQGGQYELIIYKP